MYLAVFIGLLLAVCGPAWIWGGVPERIAACVLPLALVLSVAVPNNSLTGWSNLQPGLLIIDLLLFALFLWIVVRFDRWWTFVMTAALAISLLSHLLRAFGTTLSAMAYATMEGLPSLLTLVALAFGTFEYRARKRSGLSDAL